MSRAQVGVHLDGLDNFSRKNKISDKMNGKENAMIRITVLSVTKREIVPNMIEEKTEKMSSNSRDCDVSGSIINSHPYKNLHILLKMSRVSIRTPATNENIMYNAGFFLVKNAPRITAVVRTVC